MADKLTRFTDIYISNLDKVEYISKLDESDFKTENKTSAYVNDYIPMAKRIRKKQVRDICPETINDLINMAKIFDFLENNAKINVITEYNAYGVEIKKLNISYELSPEEGQFYEDMFKLIEIWAESKGILCHK